MAMSRRGPRGGPVPAAGARSDMPGARLVAPAPSQAAAQRLRQAMAASARPTRVQLVQERLTVEFFREAAAELRKVHWPTWEQARNLTLLVIAISIAVGMILGGIDYLFAKLFQLILGT